MAKGGYKQRMEAYVKELVNPMSYYEWINKNTTIQGLPFTCDRYPFQKAIIDDVSTELHCIKPSQIGLCLKLDTPIITTKGWTTIGEISVGDYVYAPDGEETKVTFKSEVYTDHPCYEITFSCGTKIVADENHKWKVDSQYKFESDNIEKVGGRYVGVTTTKELYLKQHRNGRNSFSIENTKPLESSFTAFDLDPYILGLWLGNGNSHTGYITLASKDVADVIQNLDLDKYCVEVKDTILETTKTLVIKVKGSNKTIMSLLKELNIKKGVKVFPTSYLLGSKNQRIRLIQGLMDTDGSIEKNGSCQFTNINYSIIEGLRVLLSCLGITSHLKTRGLNHDLNNSLNIKRRHPIYVVNFRAFSDTPVFSLKRKACLQLKRPENNSNRYSHKRKIVSVIPVEPTPVQCIQVDHPDHLFLCSESLITTHNTEVQLRKAMAFVARNPHRNLIYTMPDENMRKRVFQNRVLPILTQDTVFQELNAAGQKPVRSIEMTEINNSFMLMFPANEKAATSQPADAVFNDEIDLSDPQILALFNSRLQGSDIKMNHNFSTPSYQGLGIDALYETSDQHEYMFKCPHCGFYQLPKFDSKFIRIPGLPAEASDDLSRFELTWLTRYNINPLDAYSVCCKCGKKVTYGDEKNHAWVAKYPHRTNSRGYKISPFSTRNLDAAYVTDTLIKYLRGENLKGFKNTVLGETHENSDERLPEAVLRRLFTAHFDPLLDSNDHLPHFIGIDMGKVCHVSIGSAESVNNVKYKLIETVKAEELLSRLDGYFKDFDIVGGFIDRLPLITESDRVRDKTYMKIMPMQYELTSGGSVVLPKEDEYGNLSYIAAHRTMHLDMFATAVKSAWLSISGYGSQKETIINHLRAMVRTLVEGKDGSEKTPVWVKKDKNDHYFHSMAYMYQAVYQHYNGYSFLPQQSYNSSIYLGTMDNFIVADHSLFGRK